MYSPINVEKILQGLWNHKLSLIGYTLAVATFYCGYRFVSDLRAIDSNNQARSLRAVQNKQDAANYHTLTSEVVTFNISLKQAVNDLTEVTHSLKATDRSTYYFDPQKAHAALTNILQVQSSLESLLAKLTSMSFNSPVLARLLENWAADYKQIANDLAQYRQFYVDLIRHDIQDIETTLFRIVDVAANLQRQAESLPSAGK